MIYKILWIEDDEDWILSLSLNQIENHLKDYGFIVDIEFRTSEEEIDMEVDGMQYDLIVIDFNITNEGKTGAEVISSVRENQCLTDVIFYSAKSITELRKEAFEKELDGVFFSTRENDSLLWKIRQLFDLNVKHLMSISNVRGLVMSGVADLDIRLLSLINDFNNKIDEALQLDFRKKIVSKLIPKYSDIRRFFISEDEVFKTSFSDILKKCEGFEPNILAKLLEHRAFSSFKRVESIETLCKYKKIKNEYENLIENIKNILKWRNALAHQVPDIKEDIKYFEIDNQWLPFDSDQSKKILIQLRNLEADLNEFSAKVIGAA